MKPIQIAVVIGSLRRESFNHSLAKLLAEFVPQTFSMRFVPIGGLPLYNQDDDFHPNASVTAFKASVAEAEGVLFVSPEYNRPIPGVLKNAIDHGSRPYGKSIWAHKPAGIIGISPGATGTAMAQQHLRNVLAYLDVPTMGQPEAFIRTHQSSADHANIVDDATRSFLRTWMGQFTDWIERHVSSTLKKP